MHIHVYEVQGQYIYIEILLQAYDNNCFFLFNASQIDIRYSNMYEFFNFDCFAANIIKPLSQCQSDWIQARHLSYFVRPRPNMFENMPTCRFMISLRVIHWYMRMDINYIY